MNDGSSEASGDSSEASNASSEASAAGFGGMPVVTFESRRAREMASLIARNGGRPMSAPALREVVLTENVEALAFARALRQGHHDTLILMTGVGTRALMEEVAPELDRAAFIAALASIRVIARGPKPSAVLREIGLTNFVIVPSPNTWREVLAAIPAPRSQRIAVQEHGAPSAELYAALRDAGATVSAVPVYKWALPEDTGPLRKALHALACGEAKIALFTSRSQVEHAFTIAADEGVEATLRAQLARGVVASIGPVCSEALRAEGLRPDIEPTIARMGQLVQESAARSATILLKKSAL